MSPAYYKKESLDQHVLNQWDKWSTETEVQKQ